MENLTSVRKPDIILVECGSFNPITILHLRMFEMARDYFQRRGFKVVKGIISPVNDNYDKKDLVAAPHRVEMSRLAVNSSDWITVDEWEAGQPEYVTTVGVMRHLQSIYAENKCTRLILLCGADLLASFTKPGVWSPEHIIILLTEFHIAVVERELINIKEIIFGDDTLFKYQGGIHIVHQYFPNSISSTKVRSCIRRKMSIKYLVLEPVIRYIEEHELYLDDSAEPLLITALMCSENSEEQ